MLFAYRAAEQEQQEEHVETGCIEAPISWAE